MADVSGARNFWGRVVDGILPGNQYDRQTGQFSNIGSGIAGFIGNQIAPGIGTLAVKGWERRGQGGFGGLFQNNQGAINQMANPSGNGYALQPWGGLGLPGLGENPFSVNYQPPQNRGLSFGNGHYNNGPGAGTGWGATNYQNDAWGEVAAGFGVGAGNSGWANRQTGADIRGNQYAQ